MIMTTQEVALWLEKEKIKTTSDQVAVLARNGAFRDATKEGNKWRIPEESVREYIQAKKRQTRRIRITASGILFVIGVLGLISIVKNGLDLYNTYLVPQSNTKPVVKALSTDQVFNSIDTRSNPPIIICRDRIRVSNTGGVPTLVTAVQMIIRANGDDISVRSTDLTMYGFGEYHTAIINVWGPTPPEAEEYIQVKSLSDAAAVTSTGIGARLPARVEPHSTTDIFIDITVVGKNGIGLRNIAVDYLLEFPDLEPVSSPRGDCLN